MNEAGATTFAGVYGGLVGDANVIRRGAPGTGSEDFSFMTENTGCYVIIGNGESSSSPWQTTTSMMLWFMAVASLSCGAGISRRIGILSL